MTWHLARSLTDLRGQVNKRAPSRSKTSDGTIGDPAHSARTSAHNPDASGAVRAWDCTDDPAGGCDAHMLAQMLLHQQDPRLRLVISRGRIGSGPAGPSPGLWRRYTGSNPHVKHAHIEVVAGSAGDRSGAWTLTGWPAGRFTAQSLPPTATSLEEEPVLTIGAAGPAVAFLQECLRAEALAQDPPRPWGKDVTVDGQFGEHTQRAVDQFQRGAGLPATGAIDGVTAAVLAHFAPAWA